MTGEFRKLLEKYEKQRCLQGETTPFTPAKTLLEKYFRRHWIKLNYGNDDDNVIMVIPANKNALFLLIFA